VNKRRRAAIAKAVAKIEEAKAILEDVSDEETDAMCNLEDCFSGTERYSKIESNVELIDGAVSSLDDVIGELADVA